MYDIERVDGTLQARAQSRRPTQPPQERHWKVMNLHAIEVNGTVERDVEILWAVNVGGVDMHVVP
jgi:hypothetical protein